MTLLPENTDAALYKYVIPSIESKGLKVASKLSISNNHHTAFITTNGKKFYVIFKKQKFMTYSKQFNNTEQIGESINREALQETLDRKFDRILIVYQDGSIYTITPKEWKQFADKNNTYRQVEMPAYKQEYNKILHIKEITVSVMIKELIRWNPL